MSEAIFARRSDNDSTVKWTLYDVYKIAPNYPLEISLFGHLLFENYMQTAGLDPICPAEMNDNRLILTKKFLSKSTRDDLKGLTLTCGLVVSILQPNPLKVK